MLVKGFLRSKYDNYAYFKKTPNESIIYLVIYMDDMLIICRDMAEIDKLKDALKLEFEMNDLGAAKKILIAIDIVRDKKKGIVYWH